MMQFIKQNYLILILLALFSSACKEKSIVILKKEVSMQMPGRQMTDKSALYKVTFVPKIGSSNLSFQKVCLAQKELSFSVWNLKAEKQTAFNELDTLQLIFTNIDRYLESSSISDANFVVYYFEHNKLKKMKVDKFELIKTPINQ